MNEKTEQTKPRKKRAGKVMPPTTWHTSERFPYFGPRPQHINHFGLSGGKDSTALAIWAKYESGYDIETVDLSFCDTGNESPITLDYLKYLEDALQIGITWIHPGLKFFELAKWKNRFPGAKTRFCTQFLKIVPTLDYINATFRAGHTMTLHEFIPVQPPQALMHSEERWKQWCEQPQWKAEYERQQEINASSEGEQTPLGQELPFSRDPKLT